MKFVFLLSAIILSFSAVGQNLKSCDLSIRFTSPEDSSYSSGARVDIDVIIKNSGPEDITTNDTIRVGIFSTQILRFKDISAGDSVLIDDIGIIINDDTADLVTTICVRLLQDSVTYYDANSVNDESCVSFSMDGRNLSNNISSVAGIIDQLSIVPNPARGRANILHMPVGAAKSRELYVRDVFGKVIRKYTVPPLQENFILELDGYASGVYLIEVWTNIGISRGKLLVR